MLQDSCFISLVLLAQIWKEEQKQPHHYSIWAGSDNECHLFIMEGWLCAKHRSNPFLLSNFILMASLNVPGMGASEPGRDFRVALGLSTELCCRRPASDRAGIQTKVFQIPKPKSIRR